MANQQNSYTGSQGTGTNNADFSFTFPSFTTSEVKVEVDNVVKTLTTHYTVENYNTTSGGTVRFTAAHIPTGTTPVRIFRQTDVDSAKATFTAGSSLKAGEINDNFKQVRHALQEAIGANTTDRKVQEFNIEDGAVTSAKIKDLTIVDADIAAAAEIEVYKLKDGAANQVLVTQSDGTTVGWSSNVDLPGTLDVTGNVDFDANLNVDGNLTVDGTAHLDDTNVVGYLNVVGTANVDNILLNSNEVETLSGNLTIDSAGGTTTIDDNLVVSGTTTFQNATANLNGSQIVTETASQTLTNKTLTTPVINDLSGTAVVTSGTSTSDNKIYSAKRSDELYYRKGTADDIEESGVPWSGNDSTIATTAAIDARIVDILDDVGGFVPLADEGEIPQYHPEKENKDTADRVGTILSIGTLTQTYTPSTGTVTIQASDLTNHSVNATITDCGSTVLSSGFGVLVETKAQTDSQYAAGPSFKFHRLVPKATEVTTVAANATQVGTVHTNITQVQTVHNNISNINAVAADATDIGAVAGKATEIGRLGTADAVADMAILGTADVVSDLNTLGTADVVADMNMLATSDVVADMNMLAVSDVISDMNDLATSGNITAMSTCSTNIASINNCSTNISSANTFGDQYQVAANNPSTDGGGNALAAGDLYFNTSANELKVYNGSSWQGGVTATGTFAATTGNTFTGDNRYNDGVKALFGTGSDLQIYHYSNNSYITNDTGSLYLKADNLSITTATGSESLISGTVNGSVNLYYDDDAKLTTTSVGIDITGTTTDDGARHDGDVTFIGATSGRNVVWDMSEDALEFRDNAKAIFGTGSDLEVYHDENHSRIVSNTGNFFIQTDAFRLRSQDLSDLLIAADNDSGVDLYFNNSKKFETTSTGANVTSANDAVLKVTTTGTASTDDSRIELITQESSFIIQNDRSIGTDGALTIGDGTDTYLQATKDAETGLYFNNSKKFETAGHGINITGGFIATGNSLVNDNGKIQCGDGADLQLYHDGSNSHIKSNTNALIIRSDALRINNNGNTETMIKADADGAVELYHGMSGSAAEKKLETTSAGATITPDLILNNASGDTALRWADGGTNKFSLYQSSGTLRFYDNTNSAERMRIDSSGNVGIGTGTDAVDRKLHVKSAGLIAKLESTSANSLLMFATPTNESANTIPNIGADDNDFAITTGNIERMRINSSGKVGIGETSMDALLVIKGDSDANTTPSIRLKDGTDTREAWITNTSGDLILANGGNDNTPHCKIVLMDGNVLKFATANTERMAVDSVGLSPSADSTYNIGTNSTRWANGYFDTLYGDGSNLTGINTDLVSDTSPQLGADLDTNSHHILIDDGHAVKWGNDTDLEIQHTGSYAHTHNATGNYIIDTTGNFYVRNSSGSSTYMYASGNEVALYHAGNKKFMTQSDGARIEDGGYLYFRNDADNASSAIRNGAGSGQSDLQFKTNGTHRATLNYSGHFEPAATNTYDLGTSSYRWRNIYTNDLNLSNEGGANDVDGTWGDWTIQEGESNLFLKNNRNGKKYKFNLTEVS